MTKFLDKSFSVPMSGDQQYRDNWEATFGKKEKAPPTEPLVTWPMGAHCPDCERATNEEKPEPQKKPEPCNCGRHARRG